MLILPPEKKRKIGSKEPENRQNLSFATPSLKSIQDQVQRERRCCKSVKISCLER